MSLHNRQPFSLGERPASWAGAIVEDQHFSEGRWMEPCHVTRPTRQCHGAFAQERLAQPLSSRGP